MKPLISVIIPTFNRQSTVGKALKSVLNQSYKNIEVIICDDGSTDNTKKLVSDIRKNDSRVRWLDGNHSGHAAMPRNRGIQAAKGEWIAFLDSDDYWFADKLERQVAYLDIHSAICSNADRTVDGRNQGQYLDGPIPSIIEFDHLLKANLIISSSVLVRRQIIIQAGCFPEDRSLTVGEDYALWLRIATRHPFFYIDSPLLAYRDEPEDSLRHGGNGHLQKRAVLHNYIGWAYGQSLSHLLRAFLAYLKHETYL